MRLIIFLLSISAAFGFVSAQSSFDPTRPWYTVHTPHFDIHYHDGLSMVASQSAIYAEDAYAVLLKEYGTAPSKIQMVIADEGENINGFSKPDVDTIAIFTAQFRSADDFNTRIESWWQAIIFHELVHAIDLKQKRGPSLDWLFGDLPAQGSSRPWPFVEGMAVYQEFKHLGHSRLDDPKTHMVLRGMILDQKLPTLSEIMHVHSRKEWPSTGYFAYYYGSWLVRYLDVEYGDDAVSRLVANNAGMLSIKDFNQPFVETFGKSLDEIYLDFLQWLPTQFEKEIAQIRSKPLTQTKQLTVLGYLAASPTEGLKGIVYQHLSPLRRGIRIVDYKGDHELLGAAEGFPKFSPGGKSILFTSNQPTSFYQSLSDLYIYDLETEVGEQVTHGSRVYFAEWAGDAKSIFVAQNKVDGSTSLGRLDVESKSISVLKTFENQDGVIHSFAVSKDSSFLILTLLRRDGFQDLYQYWPGSGRLVALTQNRDQETDPALSLDQKYVIYSSDTGGLNNLFAYRLADARVFQITNLEGGAFFPTMSVEGENIIFVGYSSSGSNLYQIPYDPSAWWEVTLEGQTRPASTFPAVAEGENYQPLRYLAPKFWKPITVSNSFGFGIGGGFSGGDPVGEHAYDAAFGVGINGGLIYDVNYIYSKLAAPLEFRFSGLGAENKQSATGYFWNPDGFSAIGYERTAAPNLPSALHSFSFHNSGLSGTVDDLARTHTQLQFVLSANKFQDEKPWFFEGGVILGNYFRLPNEDLRSVEFDIRGAFTTSDAPVSQLDLASSTFGIRGFSLGQNRGRQLLSATLAYGFPRVNIDTGIGDWPVFFDDLVFSVFSEVGFIGDPLSFAGPRFSVGAQADLTSTFMFLAPGVHFVIGIAQGWGEPNPLLYYRFELPSLF